MKIKAILGAICLCIAANAGAQQINPLTKAVLNGYQAILNENPKDYDTLYQRATQYYNLSMYNEALVDIIKAIDYTPAKSTSLRVDEYALLADIYIQVKEYDKALNAVNNALALSPRDYALLYQKGNIELYLNNPEEAYQAFSSMQSLKSRSQEAYFGMARADIMMDKKTEAKELIKQAENADPSNYVTFCRIGELYEDMKEDENAAANYLSAFSLADGKSRRPLESLIKLADKNYNAVEAAIQYAVSRTTNTDALFFLQASIAYNSGNYQQAYDAFTKLLQSREGQIASVYTTMAKCCLALNKLGEASTNADMAVLKANGSSTATAADQLEAQLAKAMVEEASGNYSAALLAATKALRVNPNSVEALIQSALANIGLKDGDAAIQNLNEAIMTDPQNTYAQMLRAYVNFNILNDAKTAIVEYTRIGNTPEADTFNDIMYQSLAKCLAGKKLDGDEMMKHALEQKEYKSKEDYYLAAVYYSQTGDLAKGKEMIDKAINMGYQNQYNLYANKTADLNISPLRHLLLR